MLNVLPSMRLMALVLAAIAGATPTYAQATFSSANSSATGPAASSGQDGTLNLPVSLDKIKMALEQAPAVPLLKLDDKPIFRIQVQEKNKIKIEDLIASMDFKSGPVVGGGVYAYEQNRLVHPPVDNPVRQPYSAFSQSELLTIVIENLAAKYLGGKALNAVTSAQRAAAEQAARQEVQEAIAEYCAEQPHGGVGIQLCAQVSVR